MDCPWPIKLVLPHMVVVNQALHGNTKVRGPGVEAIQSKPPVVAGTSLMPCCNEN